MKKINKKITSLVLAAQELAINNKDICTYYQSNVQCFQVYRIENDGYAFLNQSVYLDYDSAEEGLKSIIEFLKKEEEENE